VITKTIYLLLFCFLGLIITNIMAAQSPLSIQQINWKPQKIPTRMTIVAHNPERTCYDVIGFYPDVAKSFSVKYVSIAGKKKWIAKFGAWECISRK
jgi:hypothetical protein